MNEEGKRQAQAFHGTDQVCVRCGYNGIAGEDVEAFMTESGGQELRGVFGCIDRAACTERGGHPFVPPVE